MPKKREQSQSNNWWANRIVQYGEQPANQFLAHDLNARRHPAKQREALRGSLDAVGWIAPVIVSARTSKILDGHARIEEALSRDENAPVPFAEVDVSENEERTILATFDPITGLATYDREALDALLREVDTGDAALQSLIADLAAQNDLYLNGDEPGEPVDAEPQIDRAAELNKKWQVQPGDLWLIGPHRLLCGDSTKAEDVARVMGGERAELMNTDPPYGIAYVSNAQSKDQAQSFTEIENDDLDGIALQSFLEAVIRAAVPHLAEHAAFYLWHPMLTQGTFFAAAAAADILIHRQIIWVKPSLVFGRGDYHWQHELCFYGWRRGFRPAFYGERNQTTIWAAGREGDCPHPTQKPLKLFEVPILNHTKKGESVYEPFAGSGSQLVAAQNLNRKCYAIEISPDYCAVILERMATAFPQLKITKD